MPNLEITCKINGNALKGYTPLFQILLICLQVSEVAFRNVAMINRNPERGLDVLEN